MLALKSGAYSPRAIAKMAEDVHERLLDVAPYLSDPVFAPQVSRYLEAAARERLIHRHIVAVSDEKGPGRVPQRLWEAATACTRLAAKLADQLGLSPRGHAELKAIAGHAELTQASLADLAERGAEIRARRMAEFAARQEHLDGPESGADDEQGELEP